MPQPETSHRLQYIVLWAATNRADRHGQMKVTDVPVELLVRYDDSRREVPDGNGNTITIDASAIVDQDVPLKSVVWVGRLADLQIGTAFAFEDGPLMTVAFFNKVPDVRNRQAFREIMLTRYRGALPPLKV